MGIVLQGARETVVCLMKLVLPGHLLIAPTLVLLVPASYNFFVELLCLRHLHPQENKGSKNCYDF